MARRQDNFGLLRLGAALAVLVSHAFGLTGRADPLRAISSESLADSAVSVFFAISGFLVVGSWTRDPHLMRFAGRRVKRIWPGLIVAVLFTAFVAGPVFTHLSLRDYLGSPGTRDWVVAKLLMQTGNVLPGLFTSNPMHIANGSLWTLPVEVKAYVLVAVLGIAGLLRRRWFVWAAWVVCVEGVVLLAASGSASAIGLWPREIFLFAVFLGGAVLYMERERVPLRGTLAAALIAAWFLARGTLIEIPMGAAAFPYGCLWFAYRTRPVLSRFFERTDLSYGVYLYAYPVEQGIRAALGSSAGPALTIGLAVPISAALAFASWRFVESPWLKRRRGRQLRELGAGRPQAVEGDPDIAVGI
jgi:peptidoglycan/LPS O-acetylase OafA/YrhL